jgi:hypothetical protein
MHWGDNRIYYPTWAAGVRLARGGRGVGPVEARAIGPRPRAGFLAESRAGGTLGLRCVHPTASVARPVVRGDADEVMLVARRWRDRLIHNAERPDVQQGRVPRALGVVCMGLRWPWAVKLFSYHPVCFVRIITKYEIYRGA